MEILFSSDPSKLDVKRAISLKYDNTPSSLFKYKSFDSTGALDILRHDEMWLSNPTSFNDPFDCGLNVSSKDLSEATIRKILAKYIPDHIKKKYKITNEELIELSRSKNIIDDLAEFTVIKTRTDIPENERARYIEEEKRKIKEDPIKIDLKNHIHVTCFSETNENTLMWSHYANNHEGFCIEYDFKELGINNPVTRFMFPVTYTNTVFDIKDYFPDSDKEFDNVFKEFLDDIKEDDIFKGFKVPPMIEPVNNMVMHCNALIKAESWEYEKEWRYILLYAGTESEILTLPVPKPKAIYLGAEVCKQNCEEILKIAKERNIEVYMMVLKPFEFGLEPKLIPNCNAIPECKKNK